MELRENMQFEMTTKFIPNFSKAKWLKVTSISETTVSIEMENARSKGVFPIDQFHSLIRDGALILHSHEDTA